MTYVRYQFCLVMDIDGLRLLDLLGEPLPSFVGGQVIRFLEVRER